MHFTYWLHALYLLVACTGSLGLWRQPVPAHYPPPVGEAESAAAAPAAAAPLPKLVEEAGSERSYAGE